MRCRILRSNDRFPNGDSALWQPGGLDARSVELSNSPSKRATGGAGGSRRLTVRPLFTILDTAVSRVAAIQRMLPSTPGFFAPPGSSVRVISTCVVSIRPAIEPAFRRAVFTTLAGSMMPALYMST